MSVLPFPVSDRALGATLPALIAERHERFAAAAERCRSLADDEAVHDLRVSARRLESALDVWRGALADRSRRRATRWLRDLRRGAGDAREREVSTALLAERLARGPGDPPDALRVLVAELEPRVAKARRRVAKQASEVACRELVRRLERALEPVAGGTRELSARTVARSRLEFRRQTALDRLMAARITPTDGAMHAARVAVKKWRYAEESFAAGAGSPPAPARGLRELQRVLGAVHDAAVLRDLLLEWADRWRERDRGAEAAPLAAAAAEIEAERLAAAERFRESPEAALTR